MQSPLPLLKGQKHNNQYLSVEEIEEFDNFLNNITFLSIRSTKPWKQQNGIILYYFMAWVNVIQTLFYHSQSIDHQIRMKEKFKNLYAIDYMIYQARSGCEIAAYELNRKENGHPKKMELEPTVFTKEAIKKLKKLDKRMALYESQHFMLLRVCHWAFEQIFYLTGKPMMFPKDARLYSLP